ncbi:MAG: aldose 1-epimerase family protein [Catonella sp.]|uniref:aldose 1-epimerase family protein n=1 Tax=Catonella sp. TaxID=2382125 RepID=UPI003FA10C34
MCYKLRNEFLEIAIADKGAELVSVKDMKGKEYLWQGDAKYWGRRSPILFPFIGRLKNKEFIYEGKKYPMEQHGFARDMIFTCVDERNNEIWFEIEDNEDTYRIYPFHFSLKIGYRLCENKIEVLWEVDNKGDKTMYFNIGAHPGFNCPIDGEEGKEGYSLEFNSCGNPKHYGADNQTGLRLSELKELQLENGRSIITKEYFDETTYIFEDRQVSEVSLIKPDGKKYVTVSFDMPILAIWSLEKANAPFVCIEPWFGRCDRAEFEGELSERDCNIVLEAGEKFNNSYKIEIN